jgi:D-lactate dehydrogenase (cytochrome)
MGDGSTTVCHVGGLAAELLSIIVDERRVVSTDSVRDEHARDFSFHRPSRPDVVVYPVDTPEVASVLAFADETSTPVVAFGAGTSLEGQVIPTHGGISLDLSRMDRIIEVLPDDLTAIVQPGVTRLGLNARASLDGLFFPTDPGADATLGGMAATNASGTRTVRYGSMRRQVLALEVVLAGGRVMRTGSRARKSSAGYDLTSLFVGSEGTLGVITELTLRLYGIPEQILASRVVFTDIDAACVTAMACVSAVETLTRIELLDPWTIAAINRHQGASYVEEPTLFVELSGSGAAVEADGEQLVELALLHGGREPELETTTEGRTRLWAARHEAAYAVMATGPGKKSKSTDVCVPLSILPAAIRHAREAVARLGIEAGISGHVGDGNYHVAFMVDAGDPAEVRRARALEEALISFALEHHGTCTGEHGVGIGKRRYLEREHESAVPLMQSIKLAVDPRGIMNPGKVLGGE